MTIESVANLIKSYESALIFCHVRPDGDTLSCAFSLKYALNKLGKNAEVVCADKLPQKYASAGYFEEPLTAGKEGFGAYIAVDCASSDMLGANEKFFMRQKETISIDHHGTNTRFAKVNCVDTLASCSMIIFKIIRAMGVEVDKKLADMLLLGIVTDTGNFAHTNTDSAALHAAAELVDLGANLPEIYRLMFKNQSKARSDVYLQVVGKTRFFNNDRIAVIVTTKDLLSRYGLDRSETEGFIDYPMTIGSVEVGIAIMEAGNNAYKLSLRSKNVNVAEIAQSFGGGGHKNASGCMLFGFLEDVIDKIVFTVGNYLD